MRKTISQFVAMFVMVTDLLGHIIYNGEPRVYSMYMSGAEIFMWWFILWMGDFWEKEN